jgi:hypothetical protein
MGSNFKGRWRVYKKVSWGESSSIVNLPMTSVMELRGHRMAIAACFAFQREISFSVLRDFFDSIGQNAKYSLRADIFRFAPNIRHQIGSACSCQQIAHRAVHRAIVQPLNDLGVRTARGGDWHDSRSSSLYLLDDGKDVGGEGVCCLPVCRYALCLRIPEVGAVSQNRTLCLLLSESRSRPICDQCVLLFANTT